MKYLISFLLIFTSVLAHGYAHEGLYKSLARPYVEHCKSRAEKAGVSRPNEQVIVNSCLDAIHIRVARAIANEYPEYARISGRDPESDVAQNDLVQALHMYEDNVVTDPVTGQRASGRAAQRFLEIELGRKIDQRNSMQNQPSLMTDED
ncbi:MAG: hypothetical protein K0R29_2336 [Pseudobdellovibrio sp.]|jgi:hypothetical protein|nr:hypothetical protein [Pseudobdellovibrio sp.]